MPRHIVGKSLMYWKHHLTRIPLFSISFVILYYDCKKLTIKQKLSEDGLSP